MTMGIGGQRLPLKPKLDRVERLVAEVRPSETVNEFAGNGAKNGNSGKDRDEIQEVYFQISAPAPVVQVQ